METKTIPKTEKNSNDLDAIFEQLKKLLQKHAQGLELRTTTIGPTAIGTKRALHLYGKKNVSILGRKAQRTYVSGIIMQKHFVGFYSMPIYSHPALRASIRSEKTKKMLKGKSCINVTNLDEDALADLERVLEEGIATYKKEGWI